MNKKAVIRLFYMTKSEYMKYIMASAVVAILILAPLGSYLYLKSGFSYRLKAMEELEPKEIDSQLKVWLSTALEPNTKVTLIHLPGEEVSQELALLKQLDERIVDKTSFEIISFADEDPGYEGDIIYRPGFNVSQIEKHPFLLLDTAGIVRNYYDMDETTSKRLIKHLAVLIPMPERREIKLKRELKEG